MNPGAVNCGAGILPAGRGWEGVRAAGGWRQAALAPSPDTRRPTPAARHPPPDTLPPSRLLPRPPCSRSRSLVQPAIDLTKVFC